MPTSSKSKPYDRQPNETDKSWAAFCVYRDLGRERTLEKAQKQCNYKSCYNLFQWSSKYKWRERCRAFDDEESERVSIMLQKERYERRLQMEKQAWERRDKLIKKADMIARIPLVKPEVSEDGTQIFMPTDKWSLKDAIAFYQYSDNLGIFATGGETKKMDIIDAINVLARDGVLPPEFTVIASKGVEQCIEMLKELLKNGTSNISEQFESTEPISNFSDILGEGEDISSPIAATDQQ